MPIAMLQPKALQKKDVQIKDTSTRNTPSRHRNVILEPQLRNGNGCNVGKRKPEEKRIVQQLSSEDADERRKALKILCRRGGPGAGRYIAEILNGMGGDSAGNRRTDRTVEEREVGGRELGEKSVEEKLLAIRAIFEISLRTGMYHRDSILQLERAYCDDSQPEVVREKARAVRNHIPGCSILTIVPGMRLDDRLLVD